MKDRPLIGIVRAIGSASDLLLFGTFMTIEFKRAVLFENRQLLEKLQLIWSVHNNTTMLVLPLQPDREFPSVLHHLKGASLWHITSSINSTRGVSIVTQFIGTRP